MAKMEYTLTGSFDALLDCIHSGILSGLSASYEDGSDWYDGAVRCSVRVYERYSLIGSNRVSLSVTVIGNTEGQLFVSAITSGGSQAVLFKLNTLGEESFLDKLDSIIRSFRG